MSVWNSPLEPVGRNATSSHRNATYMLGWGSGRNLRVEGLDVQLRDPVLAPPRRWSRRPFQCLRRLLRRTRPTRGSRAALAGQGSAELRARGVMGCARGGGKGGEDLRSRLNYRLGRSCVHRDCGFGAQRAAGPVREGRARQADPHHTRAHGGGERAECAAAAAAAEQGARRRSSSCAPHDPRTQVLQPSQCRPSHRPCHGRLRQQKF
jgi:hypothetical protein